MGKKAADYSEERFTLAGEALGHLDACVHEYREVAHVIKGFSVRCPQQRGGEYLLTCRALDEDDEPVVCFHGASQLTDLWIGFWNRFINGDLKWKEDTWAK